MKPAKSITVTFAALAIVLFSCIPGRANAQMETNRIESLAQRADAIVVGRVTSVRSEWNADKTRIITKVSVDVDEYVKGDSATKTMVITQLGGEVDGVGELYSHTAAFSQGEDVLVFVKKDSKNNLNVAGGNRFSFLVVPLLGLAFAISSEIPRARERAGITPAGPRSGGTD